MTKRNFMICAMFLFLLHPTFAQSSKNPKQSKEKTQATMEFPSQYGQRKNHVLIHHSIGGGDY